MFEIPCTSSLMYTYAFKLLFIQTTLVTQGEDAFNGCSFHSDNIEWLMAKGGHIPQQTILYIKTTISVPVNCNFHLQK